MASFEVMLWALVSLAAVLLVYVALKLNAHTRWQSNLPDLLNDAVESKHREMLTALHEGLAKQTDRMGSAQADAGERLRFGVTTEVSRVRNAVEALDHSQTESLAANREALIQQLAALTQTLTHMQDELKSAMLAETLTKIAEQGRAGEAMMQATLTHITQQLQATIEALTKTLDLRLFDIGGKVDERLDEGFKRTNETFVNVMARLATIDEAQKKIDGLTTNVVSLQQLLGDKRSRGAFGEVQLEALVRNMMPPGTFQMQYTFANKSCVDCVLFLPEPTGTVAVDSKFPLENYRRMFEEHADVAAIKRQFAADLRKHVDDISNKYIIANVTSDGAVMFVPAEAVFAEIHANHAEIIEYANRKRVWIVSPTTLMAVLNTARAVMKDVETRKQVHIIKDELGKLGKDFARFDDRMKKLADHIRQANRDADEVAVSSRKISERFNKIERVELDEPERAPQLRVVDVEHD